MEAYGAVDETNAAIGLVRLHTADEALLDPMLARIQNELFDLGADLATPLRDDEAPGSVLRILDGQVERLEREIDEMNGALPPLASFVLPGGAASAAALHLARTICRRAERSVVALAEKDEVPDLFLIYLNRLSDLLFTLARVANHREGKGDVTW